MNIYLSILIFPHSVTILLLRAVACIAYLQFKRNKCSNITLHCIGISCVFLLYSDTRLYISIVVKGSYDVQYSLLKCLQIWFARAIFSFNNSIHEPRFPGLHYFAYFDNRTISYFRSYTIFGTVAVKYFRIYLCF